MQAIILEAPGRFTAADCPEPEIGPGQALVRVHRIGVCGTDLHAFAGNQPFFSYPRVLGHELGVEVVDPGDDPRGLKPGDRCAVEPYLDCGLCPACRGARQNCCESMAVLGVHIDGGMRPLIAVPSRKLHRSARLGYDQLALVEMLAIGAHAADRARTGPGDLVAVIGAGPIGLSVAQFASASGARVAILDTNESRLDFCQERLGIREIVNPARENVKVRLAELFGEPPTVVFDATGNARSMEASFELPGHGARLVFVGIVQAKIAFDDPSFHRRELDVISSRNALPENFRAIITGIEEGRIDTNLWITHRFSLSDTPARFPSLQNERGLLKAMITVD